MENAPQPGHNAMYDFNRVMDLVTSWDKSAEDYEDGLGRLEATISSIISETENLHLDFAAMRTEADHLKKTYQGDILPALDHLSLFILGIDEWLPESRSEYLSTLLWWVVTAREYIQRNMEISKRIVDGKLQF